MPLNRDETVLSFSAEAIDGSAKRSPTTMANEKEFLACSFASFSKTRFICPSIAPMTILKIELVLGSVYCRVKNTDFRVKMEFRQKT